MGQGPARQPRDASARSPRSRDSAGAGTSRGGGRSGRGDRPGRGVRQQHGRTSTCGRGMMRHSTAGGDRTPRLLHRTADRGGPPLSPRRVSLARRGRAAPGRLTVRLARTTMTLWSSTRASPQRWQSLRRRLEVHSARRSYCRRPMQRLQPLLRRLLQSSAFQVRTRARRMPGRRFAGPCCAICTSSAGLQRRRIEPRARRRSFSARSQRMSQRS